MTGTIAEIVRAFGVAEREMKKKLGSLDVGSFSELKATRTQQDLNTLLDGLNRYSARWARTALAGRYADSQARARTRLEMIGAERNRGFDKGRHFQAVERSLDATLKDFVKATGAMRMLIGRYIEGMRKYSGSLMQVQEFDDSILGEIGDAFIGNLVRQSIEDNRSRGVISREIMRWLRDNLADGNYIRIGNRMYNVRDYSELVARTRMIEASTEAVKVMCDEYENDLVEFSTHDNPCDECAALEGQIFSISGTDPEYPGLTSDVEPPVHPRCEHNLNPVSRIALSWRGRN